MIKFFDIWGLPAKLQAYGRKLFIFYWDNRYGPWSQHYFAEDRFRCTRQVAAPAKGGGAKEDRTPDLYNAIVALSQLSYDPNVISFVKEKTFPMQQKNQGADDYLLQALLFFFIFHIVNYITHIIFFR